MDFDIYSIIAAAGAGQGLFLAILLWFKKENKLPNRILALFLFLLAFTLFQWVLWWTGGIQKVPAMMGLGFSVPMLYGPLMYLFYQSTFERKKLAAQDLLHFIPASLGVFLMLPFYLRFFENLANALHWIPPVIMKPWFPVLLFIHMIGYGIWIGLRFQKYFLGNNELRKWHRYILAAYWGIVLTYLLYRLLSVFDLTAPSWVRIIAFSLTFFIYLIAWLGYIEPRIFQGLSLREAIIPRKYKKSSLTSDQSKIIFNRILELMEKDKIYCQEDFSLDKLAKKLNEQRHHISQAINEQSGMSIPQFVSNFRIEEARRLLAEKSKQEMNVSEVSFAVGFKTKKAFNLAFKNKTGMTPTQYRSQSNGEFPSRA